MPNVRPILFPINDYKILYCKTWVVIRNSWASVSLSSKTNFVSNIFLGYFKLIRLLYITIVYKKIQIKAFHYWILIFTKYNYIDGFISFKSQNQFSKVNENFNFFCTLLSSMQIFTLIFERQTLESSKVAFFKTFHH